MSGEADGLVVYDLAFAFDVAVGEPHRFIG